MAPPLQDKLEQVLDLSREQMEQYRDQLGHSQKIAYQQRLLQEDLVAIRAQMSRVSTVGSVPNRELVLSICTVWRCLHVLV